MNPLSVIYGLAAAICWGSGDFCGGYATKGASAFPVVLLSQVVGGALFVLLAVALGEAPGSSADLFVGAAAGLFGMVGLLALYTGLAAGHMSVFAPSVAIVSVSLPALVALVSEGIPPATTLAGFALGVPAVWLLSVSGVKRERMRASELRLALVAGCGFGLFFVFIDRVSPGAVFWPLVVARGAAIAGLSIFLLLRGKGLGLTRQAGKRWPPLQWLAIVLSGTFDAGGNACFTLSTQAGRLDVAAVLSSLYPATTALLAWMLLKERLSHSQWIGMLAALFALVLIAA